MSDLFDTLQERYQTLLARKEEGEGEEEFLGDVRGFIADAQQAGATVTDLNERSQLRAWMRFLATILYDATGLYPDVTLQPLTRGQLISPQPEREVRPSPSFSLVWMLVGGAAVIIIAVGLFIIGQLPSSAPNGVTSTPAPTSTPPIFAGQIMMSTQLDPSGRVEMAADIFCLGTSEIVAEFEMEGIEPETEWHWEVWRKGDDYELVNAESEAPWGEQTQRATIYALAGGQEGVEPGQYELQIYVDEQRVGAHLFQVLDTAPRVFNLQAADVPEPTDIAAGRNEFDVGTRVIYLNYEYEGACPGLGISHVLYHEGKPIQESQDPWSGTSQGQVQVSFQAPDDQPFPPGDYKVTVTVEGEEQGHAILTIGEPPPEPTPAFGDITIALGVQPDGTPILTARDDRFDWNTKVVYGIFDYVGMSDGLRWAALWMRNGEVVAQEEHFWDVETDGTEGMRWVTYHDELGQVLPGGSYSMTLYIENIAQQTADFDIRYYVPPP